MAPQIFVQSMNEIFIMLCYYNVNNELNAKKIILNYRNVS